MSRIRPIHMIIIGLLLFLTPLFLGTLFIHDLEETQQLEITNSSVSNADTITQYEQLTETEKEIFHDGLQEETLTERQVTPVYERDLVRQSIESRFTDTKFEQRHTTHIIMYDGKPYAATYEEQSVETVNLQHIHPSVLVSLLGFILVFVGMFQKTARISK